MWYLKRFSRDPGVYFNFLKYFPILNDFPSSGSPMITKLDNDGDLEIIAGSGSNLFIVDVKDLGNTVNYWKYYYELL